MKFVNLGQEGLVYRMMMQSLDEESEKKNQRSIVFISVHRLKSFDLEFVWSLRTDESENQTVSTYVF